MTEGRPLTKMLRFAAPLILANMLQLFYTLADSAILGRLAGVDAFAAVGATASLHWMTMSAVIGMSHGFGIVFAQRYGARDERGLSEAVASAVLCALVIGLMFTAGGLLFGRGVLEALNTPAELMNGATLYLTFMLAGMPITFINLVAGAVLRSLGDSRTPLNAMIFSTLLNITLDFALVIPFGIAGVAAATLAAQLAACVYCLIRFRKIFAIKISFGHIRLKMIGRLLRIALPLGFRDAVIEAGGLLVQVYVNGYGADVVAGVAAAKRMYSLFMLAGGAIEATVATFTAQNYGAGHFGRIRQGVRIGFWLMLGSSVVITALSLLFGRQILGLLISGDPARIAAVLDAGQHQFNMLAAGLPILYMLFLYRSALQGLGRTAAPVLSGFLELAGRFLAVTVFAPVLGIWGVYAADPIGWIGAAALLFAAYLRARKRVSQ